MCFYTIFQGYKLQKIMYPYKKLDTIIKKVNRNDDRFKASIMECQWYSITRF